MSLGCRQAPPHTTCRTPVTPSLLSRTGRQAEPPPHAPLRRPVPCALGAAPPRLTSYKTLLPWRQLCPLLPCGSHTHRHQPLSRAILSSCPPPPARHRHPPRTATLPGVGVCVLSAPPKLLRPRVPGTTLPHPRNQRPQAPPGTAGSSLATFRGAWNSPATVTRLPVSYLPASPPPLHGPAQPPRGSLVCGPLVT